MPPKMPAVTGSKPHLIYLHGFASGPDTTSKGAALRHALSARLSSFLIPDLEGPDFHDLTMDSMVQRAEQAIAALPDDGAPLLLAGSSLGAWLAAWLAAAPAFNLARRPVALLLISPAFTFVSRWRELLGDAGIAAWRSEGSRPFFHYRSQSERSLGVGFLDSCQGLPDTPAAVAMPVTVVHGRQDELAPWRAALAYAEAAADCRFHLLNEGHSLDSEAACSLLIHCANELLHRLESAPRGVPE
ncbi:MAG: alpha/beta fold hydrolase [Planctomycetota bacterium]|nr:MAG: alpha/beta fold hydrolase [Planctomycetota bacterium]